MNSLISLLLPFLLMISLLLGGAGAPADVAAPATDMFADFAIDDAVSEEKSAELIESVMNANVVSALCDEYGSIHRTEHSGDNVVDIMLFDTEYGRVFAFIIGDYHIYELNGRSYTSINGVVDAMDGSYISQISTLTPEKMLFVYSETEKCLFFHDDGETSRLLTETASEEGSIRIVYLFNAAGAIIEMDSYRQDASGGEYLAFYTDYVVYGEEIELPEWVIEALGEGAGETAPDPTGKYQPSDAVDPADGYDIMLDFDSHNDETALIGEFGSITVSVENEYTSLEATAFSTDFGVCLYVSNGGDEYYEINGKTYVKSGMRVDVLNETYIADEYGLSPEDLLNTYNELERCTYRRADGEYTYMLAMVDYSVIYDYKLYADMRIAAIEAYAQSGEGEYDVIMSAEVVYGAEYALPEWVIENMPAD